MASTALQPGSRAMSTSERPLSNMSSWSGQSLGSTSSAGQLRRGRGSLGKRGMVLRVCCTADTLESSGVRAMARAQVRHSVRLGLPSKGRMAEDTLELLKECELNVRKPNARQYIGHFAELPGVEVWFQRASDVVRKLKAGDFDMGIVGYDMVQEFGEGTNDLVVVHDALGFGACHLAVAVPAYGIFENVHTFEELVAMPQWTPSNPLRVVTGYTYLGRRYMQERGLSDRVQMLTADGALEAAPAMGSADAILDLVSSGTTLRENNLKELQGGRVLDSQGVFVVNKKSLEQRPELLDITREMLERLEAHLRAKNQYLVIANMRGLSEEDVARRIIDSTPFPGLQGPTVSRVLSRDLGESANASGIRVDYYSATVVVPKSQIYKAIRALREVGGSGVLVTPLTYIFDEEPPRWRKLLQEIGR